MELLAQSKQEDEKWLSKFLRGELFNERTIHENYYDALKQLGELFVERPPKDFETNLNRNSLESLNLDNWEQVGVLEEDADIHLSLINKYIFDLDELLPVSAFYAIFHKRRKILQRIFLAASRQNERRNAQRFSQTPTNPNQQTATSNTKSSSSNPSSPSSSKNKLISNPNATTQLLDSYLPSKSDRPATVYLNISQVRKFNISQLATKIPLTLRVESQENLDLMQRLLVQTTLMSTTKEEERSECIHALICLASASGSLSRNLFVVRFLLELLESKMNVAPLKEIFSVYSRMEKFRNYKDFTAFVPENYLG